MLGWFETSKLLRPHKRIWRDARKYMRNNPGPPTQLLWKFAVYRLEKLVAVLGYKFGIEDFARSTFNCVASMAPDDRNACIDLIGSLVAEERGDADKQRYALAGELVWTLISLVDFQLKRPGSVNTLLGLIEAGFRGASSRMRDNDAARRAAEATELRIRFQWSSFIEQEVRADFYAVLKIANAGGVAVSSPDLPDFHADFVSMTEARGLLCSKLSQFLSKKLGGPAMIWGPEGWV